MDKKQGASAQGSLPAPRASACLACALGHGIGPASPTHARARLPCPAFPSLSCHRHPGLSLGRQQAGSMDEFCGEEAAGSGSSSARTGAVSAGRGSGARGNGSGRAAMRRMRRWRGGRVEAGSARLRLTSYSGLNPASLLGSAAGPPPPVVLGPLAQPPPQGSSPRRARGSARARPR